MRKYKIYLDNCCYNRPYDDQSQLRVELETKAKLYIQKLIVDKNIYLITSVILEYENNDNPHKVRQQAINDFFKYSSGYVGENTEVVSIAATIKKSGIATKDSAHLACAIYAECDYFITTDDKLLKYKDSRIKIIDPVNFTRLEDFL